MEIVNHETIIRIIVPCLNAPEKNLHKFLPKKLQTTNRSS